MGKKSTLGAKKKSTEQKKGDVSQKSPAKAKTRSKNNKHIRGKTEPMTAETEKKEISMTDLILKKFEPWNPETLFRPGEDEAYLKNFAAPPFFTDTDEKDAERMRALLLNKFDMKSFPETPMSGETGDALSEQAAAAGKKGVSAEELVLKKFEAWKPETLFSAGEDEDYVKNFAAPPFFPDADEKESKRIAELLAAEFDIKSFPEKLPEEIKPAVVETAASEHPETVTVQAEEKAIKEPAAVEKTPPEPVSVQTDVQAEIPKLSVEATEEKAEQVTAHEPTEKIAEPEKSPEEAATGYRPPVKRAETPKKKSETPDVSETEKGKEPMERTVKYFIAAIACAFVLIISASISNVGKYYLKTSDGSLEIWQGNFAPLGEEKLVRMPGEKAPKAVKPVYEREEVFPLAFNYYVAKADALLNQPDVSDLEKIRFYVNKAISFGTTEEIRKIAYDRMKKIDLMMYLSKADIAASKGASGDFQTALDYLSKAAPLVDKESSQAQLIARKIEVIKELMASLEAKQAEISATPPAAATAPAATSEPATAPAPSATPAAAPAPAAAPEPAETEGK